MLSNIKNKYIKTAQTMQVYYFIWQISAHV